MNGAATAQHALIQYNFLAASILRQTHPSARTPMSANSTRAAAPKAIYLKDYTPPAWWVETVDLHVTILDGYAEVKATLACRRNESQPRGDLVLNGEELALQKVSLDGTPLPASRYALDAETLTTLHWRPLPDRFVLETLVRIEPDQQHAALRPVQIGGRLLHAVRGAGLPPHHLLPGPAGRDGALHLHRRGRRAALSATALERQPGRQRQRRRRPPLGEVGGPVRQALLSLRAGRGRSSTCWKTRSSPRSGRKVRCAVYVEPGKLDQCGHAMAALKKAMKWDEERFGLELDLDTYMIVAVGDFNMGAMENKGLNIFNTKYVLARPDTATDADYQDIDRVVAHEYFHNWTGNRVTCRDWFQLVAEGRADGLSATSSSARTCTRAR